MSMRLALAAAVLLVAILDAQTPAPAPHNDSIRKEDLRADLFLLASDAMQGRLTDTRENRLSAEWIRARFERLGLQPAGADGSYFHPYNLAWATLGEGNRLQASLQDGATLAMRSGQDFYPHRFSASGRVRAPLVFAGFGIEDPKLGYDDYRGPDIKGKIALIVDHEPGERDPQSRFDGLVTAESAVAIRKALAAQRKGAVGILFVSDVHNHPQPVNFEASARGYWPAATPRIRSWTLAAWMEQVRIPAAQISPALAQTLLASTQRSLEALSKASESRSGSVPVAVPGVEVEIETAVNRHITPDVNVLAKIDGTDPKLKDEWVIVCAHFDHNGADGSQIFNGADDNGSGTVGLLEIAEAYALAAANGQRPRRSILFAAWNSEERGLLGAWEFADRPLVPRDRIVAVLNMDMIGRNEEVEVGGGTRFRGLDVQTPESNNTAINILGYTRTPELSAEVETANKGYGLALRMRYDNNASNLLRRSDHWPFLQHGVPALWFHTGLHPDYHTVYDRPEKINYEKMEKIARLVHQVSWNLAQQEMRPRLSESQ
jgi:hypothetical protein